MPNPRTRKKKEQTRKNKKQGKRQAKLLGKLTVQNAKKRRIRSKLAPEPVTPKQMEREQARQSGGRTSVYNPDALIKSGDGISGNTGRAKGPGPFNTRSKIKKGMVRNPTVPGGLERLPKPHGTK